MYNKKFTVYDKHIRKNEQMAENRARLEKKPVSPVTFDPPLRAPWSAP